MDVSSKIRRHAWHLMSLATFGATCIAVFGLLLFCLPWLQDWNPQATLWVTVAGMEWEQARQMEDGARWLLSMAYAAWTLGALLPLFALRHLGARLYRHEPLSRPVARAFMWLAHSLPLSAFLSFAHSLMVTVACEVAGIKDSRFTADISGGYLFLVTCLCLYTVAHLMRLATDAADDARAIV